MHLQAPDPQASLRSYLLPPLNLIPAALASGGADYLHHALRTRRLAARRRTGLAALVSDVMVPGIYAAQPRNAALGPDTIRRVCIGAIIPALLNFDQEPGWCKSRSAGAHPEELSGWGTWPIASEEGFSVAGARSLCLNRLNRPWKAVIHRRPRHARWCVVVWIPTLELRSRFLWRGVYPDQPARGYPQPRSLLRRDDARVR